jgi:hypothetical protein
MTTARRQPTRAIEAAMAAGSFSATMNASAATPASSSAILR